MQDQGSEPVQMSPDARAPVVPPSVDVDRWHDRGRQARDRGQRAAARVAELRERREQLLGQRSSTAEDVAAARAAADDGLRRAREALQRALWAHERAAEAHDRVADYLEALAADGGPHAGRWAATAARHRASATADRLAEAEGTDHETGQGPDGGQRAEAGAAEAD